MFDALPSDSATLVEAALRTKATFNVELAADRRRSDTQRKVHEEGVADPEVDRHKMHVAVLENDIHQVVHLISTSRVKVDVIFDNGTTAIMEVKRRGEEDDEKNSRAEPWWYFCAWCVVRGVRDGLQALLHTTLTYPTAGAHPTNILLHASLLPLKACRLGHVDLVDKLCRARAANLVVVGGGALGVMGYSACHYAAAYGHEEVVRMLAFLSSEDAGHLFKLDLDLRCAAGMSPLMLAATNGNLAVVEALIELGADVGLKDDGDFTAVMFAEHYGYVYRVRGKRGPIPPLPGRSIVVRGALYMFVLLLYSNRVCSSPLDAPPPFARPPPFAPPPPPPPSSGFRRSPTA